MNIDKFSDLQPLHYAFMYSFCINQIQSNAPPRCVHVLRHGNPLRSYSINLSLLGCVRVQITYFIFRVF
jgi:hypothetical protein